MNKNLLKGLIFSGLIGLVAYFLGKSFPLVGGPVFGLSLIHISEPTRQCCTSRMPSSA